MLPPDSVGPLRLTSFHIGERFPPPRGHLHELRATVVWVARLYHQTVFGEKVGGPLDALAREPHLPSDVSYRGGSVLDHAQHLPTRASQANGLRQFVSRLKQLAVQAEDLDDKLGEDTPLVASSVHMTAMYHYDNVLQ